MASESGKADGMRRVRAYRNKLASAGQRQVQIWLNDDLRRRVDHLIEAGTYKNRSETVSAALMKLLSEDNV